MKFRTEKDSLGEVKVPAKALWGAQTQRAVNNFPISGIKMDFPFTKSFVSKKSIIMNFQLMSFKQVLVQVPT